MEDYFSDLKQCAFKENDVGQESKNTLTQLSLEARLLSGAVAC